MPCVAMYLVTRFVTAELIAEWKKMKLKDCTAMQKKKKFTATDEFKSLYSLMYCLFFDRS